MGDIHLGKKERHLDYKRKFPERMVSGACWELGPTNRQEWNLEYWPEHMPMEIKHLVDARGLKLEVMGQCHYSKLVWVELGIPG